MTSLLLIPAGPTPGDVVITDWLYQLVVMQLWWKVLAVVGQVSGAPEYKYLVIPRHTTCFISKRDRILYSPTQHGNHDDHLIRKLTDIDNSQLFH